MDQLFLFLEIRKIRNKKLPSSIQIILILLGQRYELQHYEFVIINIRIKLD